MERSPSRSRRLEEAPNQDPIPWRIFNPSHSTHHFPG
ncbi:C1orf194 isoform 2 [Pongo abelii]|uniref:C1orf194 isoform 2 n=1 Tax=Pongo abelii TaxID=9601 RepID=A0A2J8UMN4_PONAB|nr:C1orf194 isoform 2 [Pongo abelii]